MLNPYLNTDLITCICNQVGNDPIYIYIYIYIYIIFKVVLS